MQTFPACRTFVLLSFAFLGAILPPTAGASEIFQVGFARVDITPDYPIRLNGFGNRREESEGVSQSIYARAMAISQGDAPPMVILAVDNLGLRLPQVEQIAQRLNDSHQLPRQNVALTFTHTHCAPKINGSTDNIFSQAIPESHQKSIDRYTSELIDRIVESASEAIESRTACHLELAYGTVGFAKNRRTAGGPVDHDLPALIARDCESGAVRGVFVSYACHCVTMRFNQISGDWAGYAAELIERQYPDSIALVAIGAGSDQNPTEVTPDDVSIAQRQGAEIAGEVKSLAESKTKRLSGPLKATLYSIDSAIESCAITQPIG